MLQEDKMKLIDYTLGFIFPEKLRVTFRSWPLIGHKNIFLHPIKDKNSWIWFVKSSIPGPLLPVLENFRRRLS